MSQTPEALNLEQAIAVLRRRFALIVLCALVVGGAAFAYSARQPKKYAATASLAFATNPVSEQIAGLQTQPENTLTQQASDLELVRLGDMAARTATQLGHGLSEQQVARAVTVSAQGESDIVNLTATASSPALAAAIANTYTSLFVAEQQAASRRYFSAALAVVQRQLAALTPAQRIGEDGLSLQNRAQTLHLLTQLGYGNVQLAQQAIAPSGPSSPRTSRDAMLGLLLGLLIGAGLAVVLERLDRRVRTPEELAAIYERPLLGVLPAGHSSVRGASRDRGATLSASGAQLEVFNLIRARLRLDPQARGARALLIASPAAGEGWSTVACELARVEARAGARVLLVEADLRHPTLTRRLALHPAAGLAEVLTGASTLEQATCAVAVEHRHAAGGTSRALEILPAGLALPTSPTEMLDSPAMHAMLEHAIATYDLVILDTPPLGAFSDAIALLTTIDRVLVVGMVGHTDRDAALALRELLTAARANVLGVVANSPGMRLAGTSMKDRHTAPAAEPVSLNGSRPPEPRAEPVKL